MKKYFEPIVLWGSLWGITEATLGHFLHLLPFNIGFVFWFPVAYLFMHLVYKKTGKASSVLATAFLAAAFKMLDFIAPVRIDIILNPAVSIVLEGFVVFAFFKMNKRVTLRNLLMVSLFRQLLYVVYILIVTQFTKAIPAISGDAFYMYFAESIINGFTIFIFLNYFKYRIYTKRFPSFVVYSMFVFSAVINLML